MPGLLDRKRHNTNHSATGCALDFKLDGAFGLGEQGVILANAHVIAGMELGTALTHDDVARNGNLAAVKLYAQTAPGAVTTVAG